MSKTFMTFEVDKGSVAEFEKMLKQAAELPRRRITHAVKEGARVALTESRNILRKAPHNYEMSFKDGNTWDKNDIIKSMGVYLEKGKRKQKRVARVGIRDWRVALYSNFVEYGVEKRNMPATHFMYDGLTNKKRQVEDFMIEDLIKSLDKLR